jgi:tetratricopeptide (TPR) repeat protein
MYLLALMSKPTSTPLPVVMLLMDYWLLRRLNWRAIFEKIPFFMLGGIFAVITYISQSRTAGSGSPAEIGLGRILLVISHNIIFYLNKMIWPVNLSSHYAFPEPLNLSQPMVLAGVIGTCILIPLLLLSLRRTRAVLTGWLIFFLAILPTMQIIGFTNVIASDKFAYLPSIGLLMILAAFLVWLCRSRFLVLCRMAAVIILVLACGEAVATRRYLVCWQDTIKLYEHMLALTPNAPTVHYNIAVELKALGRIDEAIAHYRRAIEIRPDYAEAHNNLGVIVQSWGNLGEAISHYREALRNKPDYAEAYYNLGVTYSKLGRYEESIQAYRKAITIKPDSVEANNNLGSVYGKIGEWQKSAEAFQKAAEVEPNFIPYYNVGIAYERLARYKEAIEAYKQAVKIKPGHSGAHYSLGAAYLAIGDNNSALEEYKILKTLNPEQAGRLLNLIHK